MLGLLKLFLLIDLYCLFVQCLIPNLSVQKLDRKLIQRKRQDTIDMCRIFNEETERQRTAKKQYTKRSKNYRGSRLKREAVFIANPAQNPEDVQMAEAGFIAHPTQNAEDIRKVKSGTGFIANPALNTENVQRVESIVDRLYDDMEENGTKVTYRQKELKLTTESTPDASGRRLNFAPAVLRGPRKEENKTSDQKNSTDSDTVRIPWRKKWTQGIIPYFIDSKTYDSHLSELIRKAFDYFEKVTCIRLQRLRERPTDKKSLQNVEWIYITNPSGIGQCVHSNERKPNKGVQIVVFGYDCLSIGEIVHEVMHVLGYSHEHTRPDRDEHISVLWDNIKPGYRKYFERRTEDHLMSLPYDYSSVLHYPQRAFSKNGQLTLKVESGIKLGQREALSEIDVEKVTMIYGIECLERNKQYLLTTCPSVVKSRYEAKNVSQEEIEDYFKNRLWPYGIVNYKLRDKMEFSVEERENINAVIRHIERETCIEFRNLGEEDDDDDDSDKESSLSKKDKNINNPNEEKKSQGKNDEVNGDRDNRNDTDDNGSQNKILSGEDPNDGQVESFKYPNDVDNMIFGENTNNIERTKSNAPGIYFVDDPHDENETSEIKTVEGKSRVKREEQNSSPKASIPQSPTRRHAAHTLIFSRSAEPGCKCPKSGRPDGDQVLVINADCFNSVNDLLHLFLHLLGLDHQHNQYDRDSYLHIVWDNLSDEVRNEMREKLPPAASVGFQYDYQSVMHYPWLQIKNGVTNIMYPIWNDGWAMGHWQGLSSTDVHKLSLLYLEQCTKRKEYAEGKS